jgi:hypothetical protein
MDSRSTYGALLAGLCLLGFGAALPCRSTAQLVTDQSDLGAVSTQPVGVAPASDIVNIPGVGQVDLNQLPPGVADNIRIPGQVYVEPDEQYGDLPPLPQPNVDQLDLWQPAPPALRARS